jgi:MinD superfamily P-loop ATPase
LKPFKIAVASGKGGTGKTTVAVSLVLALEGLPGQTQLVDCDVEEPDAALFLKPDLDSTREVTVPIPSIDTERCTGCGQCAELCQYNALAVISGKVLSFKNLCHSCGGCAYICPARAITEEPRKVGVVESGSVGGISFTSGRLDIGEPRAVPLIRELKSMVDPRATTVLDSPPGTACTVVETVKDCDCCLLVTEPTPFGLYDLDLMVQVLEVLGVPSGIVINRDDGSSRIIDEYASKKEIPVLMRIPLKREIAEPLSRGVPLVVAHKPMKQEFLSLAAKLEDLV